MKNTKGADKVQNRDLINSSNMDNSMENPKAIAEILEQAKKIEDNNFSNMEHFTSISMLLNANDLGRTKDKELSKKFDQLNKKMDDINKLTSDLLNDLSSRHN